MMNEPSSEAHPDKVWIIYAVCINCDKRFTFYACNKYAFKNNCNMLCRKFH